MADLGLTRDHLVAIAVTLSRARSRSEGVEGFHPKEDHEALIKLFEAVIANKGVDVILVVCDHNQHNPRPQLYMAGIEQGTSLEDPREMARLLRSILDENYPLPQEWRRTDDDDIPF